MSDDIVKWLRIDSSIRNELNDCITDPTTLNKAADEIERLRAENERLRAATIEECAKAVEAEGLEDAPNNDADRAYDSAIEHAIAAIRALGEKQDG